MVYDFAGPDGWHHARQFRYQSELAAEFIQSVVRGRLVASKRRVMAQGRWAGGTIPAGFVLDERKTLPDPLA
jgi:hypothetical protein